MGMPDPPRWDEPGFWTGRGCVSLLGVFLSITGVAAGFTFAWLRFTEGLLLVIVCMLAGILMVLATKG